MKLYYTPGACSMAGHIALNEAGLDFDVEKVDLKTKRTESDRDFNKVNPKGYVPALELDGGDILTENIAILDWIADQDAALAPAGDMGRYRLLEALAFISTELHKSFKPFFADGSDDDKKAAAQTIDKRLSQMSAMLGGDYLFGAKPSVADAYLFVMLNWATNFDLPIPGKLPGFFDTMKRREAVKRTLRAEGLD